MLSSSWRNRRKSTREYSKGAFHRWENDRELWVPVKRKPSFHFHMASSGSHSTQREKSCVTHRGPQWRLNWSSRMLSPTNVSTHSQHIRASHFQGIMEAWTINMKTMVQSTEDLLCLRTLVAIKCLGWQERKAQNNWTWVSCHLKLDLLEF